MKSISKYIIVPFVVIAVLLASSCTKDFEEINKNPHGFTTASDGALFNKIIESLIPSGNEQMYVNNEILYGQSQQAALTKKAWGNFSIGTEAMWRNYYTILPNVRKLQDRFDEMGESVEVTNMKAMLKVIIAYKTFKLTDIFGDMPYSKAGYGFEDLDYLRPKFDTQRDIYLSLLDDLKWCDENIDYTTDMEEPFISFKSFDRLFNGDMLKWLKLANSLRMRYAMRMSNKEPELAGEIIKDIVERERPLFLGYDFITYLGESACLWPASMGFSNNAQNWAFREHNNLRMGSNIWHQLSANDSTDGSGIFDPRTFVFFERNNDNKWVAFPQNSPPGTPASGGIPYGIHRDNAGAYGVKGKTCIYSPFGYFFVRDANFMPIPMITGAEINFIIAEAYLRGIGLPKDPTKADIEYMNGVNASVKWWLDVAANSKLPNSGLAFSDKVSIPDDINVSSLLKVFGSWNAPTEEKKLQFIYTQRLLDAMKQPWEGYSLARRTNLTPREGEPIKHYRLPYPPSEVEYNTANWSEAVERQGGGDTPDFKIWWIQ